MSFSVALSHSAKRSAEHGFTTPRRSAEHGFTLIELMVVIVIVGLLSVAVVVTMADPRGRISGDADRFTGRVRAARDSAIISGRSVSLWISPTAYGFEQRSAGEWKPMDAGKLTATDWSSGTSAVFSGVSQLRIVFDGVGRADQTLDFDLRRGERHVRVKMDLDGRVTTGD